MGGCQITPREGGRGGGRSPLGKGVLGDYLPSRNFFWACLNKTITLLCMEIYGVANEKKNHVSQTHPNNAK